MAALVVILFGLLGAADLPHYGKQIAKGRNLIWGPNLQAQTELNTELVTQTSMVSQAGINRTVLT